MDNVLIIYEVYHDPNKTSFWPEKQINGVPVFLRKNGHGTMVVLSLEEYSNLTGNIERALIEAESAAESNSACYTREEVYSKLKARVNAAR